MSDEITKLFVPINHSSIKQKNIITAYLHHLSACCKSRSVPRLIHYICLAFYVNVEYFAKARKDCYVISDDKLTIHSIQQCDSQRHTIYLNHWISSTSRVIASWRFRVNVIEEVLEFGENSVFFGLSSREGPVDADFTTLHRPNYAISDCGETYINNLLIESESDTYYLLETGDHVTFTLDLIVQEFYVAVNGSPALCVVPVDVDTDIHYKFALQMLRYGTSLTLTSFHIHS